jgi:hypothetical protein
MRSMQTSRQTSRNDHPPVRRTIRVPISRDEAFERFTSGMADWWPLDTHSVALRDVASVVVERHLGGRVFERTRSGTMHLWGTITLWDPPGRIAMTWHPGRAAETAQELTVTFTPLESGTQVDVIHSDWNRLGEKAAFVRSTYEQGWDPVLARFSER